MSHPTSRSVDRPSVVVGVILLTVAAIIAFDAGSMTQAAMYGIGPTAMPFAVAIFFAGLGLGHFVMALRGGLPAPDDADWIGFGWVAGALVALIICIALGAGFIPGSALLFALTARAFGRRALLVDLVIGFIIAVLVFLLFNNLLSLTLPQGPLERLL